MIRYHYLAATLLAFGLNAKVMAAEDGDNSRGAQAQENENRDAIAKSPNWAAATGRDRYGYWADLRVKGVTQRFRWIDPGTFVMGAPKEERQMALMQNIDQEVGMGEVEHEVSITQGYWMADSECSQAMWEAIMKGNPSRRQGNKQLPVEFVAWTNCQDFLNSLNKQIGDEVFCLPTEAQWEYACRAGTRNAYYFGKTVNTDQVNYNGEYPFGGVKKSVNRNETLPVKSMSPNAWGLYDMHGNLAEWCRDWYGPYPNTAERDPAGPKVGTERVIRGGAWCDGSWRCRSAARDKNDADLVFDGLGFRLSALSATAPSATAPAPKSP